MFDSELFCTKLHFPAAAGYQLARLLSGGDAPTAPIALVAQFGANTTYKPIAIHPRNEHLEAAPALSNTAGHQADIHKPSTSDLDHLAAHHPSAALPRPAHQSAQGEAGKRGARTGVEPRPTNGAHTRGSFSRRASRSLTSRPNSRLAAKS